MATSPESSDQSPVVGLVLGTEDSTPLEFWVGLAPDAYLQLDDVVALERTLPGSEEKVRIFGMVTQVRARYEGVERDSDVFHVDEGTLPAETSRAALIQSTRFEPEIFVPPLPGQPVLKASGALRDEALFFDGMNSRVPAGLSREDEPIYVNLEFLDGTRGAHVNISGISGVATKTSYATFLLYGLFHSGALGTEANNTKALIFNVKGEDLLFLDHENTQLTESARARYGALGLSAGAFSSLGVLAPPRPDDPTATPHVSSRISGVTSFFWTLHEFCRDELLPFLFADAEDDRQQYTMVVHNVAHQLARASAAGDGAVAIEGQTVRTFRELVELIEAKVLDEDGDGIRWAGRSIGLGTVNAFVRRLWGAVRDLEHLIRADVPHCMN